VRIDVQQCSGGFELRVTGPGGRTIVQECADQWAVVEVQLAHEAHLLAQGFTLEHCIGDRRQSSRWLSASS